MKNFITQNKGSVRIGMEVLLVKDGDYIVAVCPALNLSSFGKTELEAKEAFNEALETFLEDAIERRTLDQALLELGWTLRKVPTANYTPPENSGYKLRHPQSIQQRFNHSLSVPI